MQAIAVLKNEKLGIDGIVLFTEDKTKKETVIKIEISGLVPNSIHGFHIHEKGNLREGCKSLCNHFNPYNSPHGDQKNKRTLRHVGDLGNLRANKDGKVNKIIRDKLIKLCGKHSVIGRSVILHEEEDDLGLGDNEESLITGNSGARIACGVEKLNARVLALENLVSDLEGYLTGSLPSSSPREQMSASSSPRDPRNSPRSLKFPKKQSPRGGIPTPLTMYGVVPAPVKPPKPAHIQFQKPPQQVNQYDRISDPL